MSHPEKMKALTIWQPWASLAASRVKRFETRGWSTEYRGPMAIHAAARPVEMADLMLPGMETAIRRHGLVPDGTPLERFPEYFPLGQVLAVADLVDCHKTDFMTAAGELQLTEEYYLGNYAPGRYAFELEVRNTFEPGIPAKGGQGWWTFTMPSAESRPATHPTPKEPKMAKTKKEKTATDKKKPGKPSKPKGGAPVLTEGEEAALMSEAQANAEKGGIDAAFSTPAEERPGVASDPNFDKPSAAEPAAVARMPETKEFVEALGADEFLPTFQKVVYVPFNDHEFADQAKAMAAADIEIKEMEAEAAGIAKEWKDKIKGVEARRISISTQVTQGGAEKEITCMRRINEATQEMTVFDAESLRVVERRKLGAAEMQTEMGLLSTQRAAAGTGGKRPRGGKIIEAKFPADRVVGAAEPNADKNDARNEAAIKALADERAG